MGKSPHEIDLTTAAAKKLGYIRSGWVKVKIEVLPEKP
jgi:rare lipoprotein A (peptidoglycan hydrolase)